jgi:tripartite-type tricarboxylate transporter receptor subunit TctC
MSIARGMTFVLAGLAFASAAAQAAPTAEDFFRGRTVNYIVATAAGGGYDGYGRLTARYMEKYLPGSTFVVVNRPGAGHLIGTNMIAAAKPDGLTMGTFNMGVIYSQLIGAKNAHYDLGKMSWIGKAATDKRIIMVGAWTPYKQFLDLKKAKEPVPFAVSGVGSAAYTELQLLANVFDLNIKLLPGYSGNDDDMAILRKEVVGKMGAITGQSGLVRDGRGRFLMQIGGERETGYGEMTYGHDIAETQEQKAVMNLIASQGEMMRITVGPPAIPAERLAALREAYRKAFADPALLADAEKLHYVIDAAVGEDAAKIVRAALDQPPRILEMIRELQNAKPENVTVTSALSEVEGGGRKIGFKDRSGENVTAELSGSRSKVQIGGKEAARDALKPGMTCAITYAGPGGEASLVNCK